MTDSSPFDGVPTPLRTALERRGFTGLTAVQEAVRNADSAGRDLRISSQTGSGKTVALGIVLAPTLLEPSSEEPAGTGPRALIITPTRELASQVSDELRWLFAEAKDTRVGVGVVTGGTDVRGEQRMLRNSPAIVVGTPGRMLDHIRTGALSCTRITQVALDEADRMLDMGFKDELDAIIDALPAERRSHLVSATFSGAVKRVADRFQKDAIHLQGTALGEANEDIEHAVQIYAPRQSYSSLVNALLLAPGEQVLVFVERRAGASELAELLAEDGFSALPFSGDLSQAQRTRTLHAFRNGTIQVLVSTDVAARGIDVPNISMVVQMSPPQDADDYTHRSGRTGRAGRQGKSLMLISERAQGYTTRLLASAGVDARWQPAPTPSRVRKAITKQTRRELHARLDAEDVTPDEKTVEYAKNLLEGRDAAVVVATLLEMAEPRLPRMPFDVQAITPLPLEERQKPDRYAHSGPRARRRGPHGNRGGGGAPGKWKRKRPPSADK